MPNQYSVTEKTFDEAELARRREKFRQKQEKEKNKWPRAWWDPEYYADPANAYAVASIASPGDEAKIITEVGWQRQQIAARASMFGENNSRMLMKYLDTGYVSPGATAALAGMASQLELPDPIIEEISKIDAAAATAEDSEKLGDRKPDEGSEADKNNLASILGEITRPAFALLSMPVDMVQGAVRNTVGMFSGIDTSKQPSPFDQSLGGQYLQGLFTSESADMGEGWVPRGDVAARQEMAKRSAAPLVHGKGWTLGRGIVSTFVDDPDSMLYNNLSGFIDIVGAIAMDPLIFTGVGASSAKAAQTGRRTAEATRIGRTAQAEAGEAALRTPTPWLTGETKGAAADYVKDAMKGAVDAPGRRGAAQVQQRVVEAEQSFDRAADTLQVARSDASAASRRGVTSEQLTRRMQDRIRRLRNSLGDDVIDTRQRMTAAAAPDIPDGVFTDAIPARGATLPAVVDQTEAIVTVGSRKTLKSVDDRIDLPADISRNLKAAPGSSKSRVKTIENMREALKTPNATYGDIVQMAIDREATGALLVALRGTGIDGITDVFRLKNGDGGVWWTTGDIDVARWMNGGMSVIDNTLPAAQQRARQLNEVQKRAGKERARAAQAVQIAQRTAEENARFFNAVVDGKMAAADAPDAVRQVAEYALGVRRDLGGRPRVDLDAVREFLVGTPKSFDEAVNAKATMKEKAFQASNRALIAAGTLGISEAARLGGKFITQPMMANVRRKIFDDFVRLSDTPENLGKLHRLSNGKIPPPVLRSVLQASNEDEVLAALAPHLGVAINRPISPNAITAVRSRTSQVRMGRSQTKLFHRAGKFIVDEAERLGTITPRGMVAVNFADPVHSSNVLRNYLNNIPGLEVGTTDRIIGRYLAAEGETGRARAVMNGFNDVADALVDFNSKRRVTAKGLREFSPETQKALKDKLRDATKLYEGGRAKTNDWWNQMYASDSKASVMTHDGKLIELPGPQIEAELARGGVMLPDVRRLRNAIGRWGEFLESGPGSKTEKIRDWGNYLNDTWRASILLRPAYVLRNIGEMQSRMFLAGHQTMFTNPLGVLGFAAAASANSGPMRNLLSRFARANKTATGYSFEKLKVGDVLAEDDAVRHFQEVMSRTTSRQDMRSYRGVEMNHNVAEVAIGQPGFNLGLADKLTELHASPLSRVIAGYNPPEVARAIARGENRDDAILEWLVKSKTGQSIRTQFADGDPRFAQIFGNPVTGTPPDPTAMRGYLFDGNAALRKRIQYYTGGNQDLANFIATGQLRQGGNVVFDANLRRTVKGKKKIKDAQNLEQALAQRVPTLARNIAPIVRSFPDDTKLQMRVLRGSDAGLPNKGSKLDQVFDWFFHWAGRVESASSVGPEFAYAYHQKMAELLPSIRRAERSRAFSAIKDSEGKLRRGSETMATARSGLKYEKEGFLTVDDASTAAARHASEHVKTFFYDAMQRRQIFHALRVVAPFIQPFFDTLWRWGKLTAQRPYLLEKVGRLGIAAHEEGSSVIYDDFDFIDPFSNQPWRDPTQGFIFKDPQSGEDSFAFPLMGSALATVLGPISGMMGGPGVQDLAGMQQLTAPLKHLNIALQGDIDYLPGLGPLITMPLSQVMPEDWFGTMPEWFADWAFPYGRPDLEGGVIESTFFPSWLRRLTGVLYNDEFRSYSIKGTMAHLLSTREYDNLHGNPATQQQFIDDTRNTSKMVTFIRALGAAVLPAAPTQDIYTVDKDGRFIGTNYLADRYQHFLDDADYDSEAATDAFLRTYGLDAIGALIPSTEGEFVFSGQAWDFYKKNPKKGEAFSDVIGLFFPGDFSLEAFSFQRDSGARTPLTEEQRTEKVLSYLYQAEKRQLEQQAAMQGWDDDAMAQAEDDLEDMYGGVLPSFSGITTEERIDRVRRALEQFPELAQTRGGQGADLAFEAYDRYITEAEDRWGRGSTLRSERADTLRAQFIAELNQITAEYGGKNKGDGSVHTISTMLARLVKPRE